MAEYEVNGKRYTSSKLDAIRAFNLMRRLGPVIAKIAPEFAGRASQGNMPSVGGLADMIHLIEPILKAMKDDLTDEDVEYIVRTCLSVTRREEAPNVWIDCWNHGARQAQFTDIDMPGLVAIGINVITENLGSFLAGSAPNSGAQDRPQGALN